MAIARRAAGTVATAASATTISPAWPVSQTGDIALLVVSSTGTVTTPTGWTLVNSNTASTSKVYVYWTATLSGAGATVPVTTTSGTSKAIIVTYSGAVTTAPTGSTNNVRTTTNAATVASLSTAFTGGYVFWAISANNSSATISAESSTAGGWVPSEVTDTASQPSLTVVDGPIAVNTTTILNGTASANGAVANVAVPLSPVVTAAIPYLQQFRGLADGAAWPAPWTTGYTTGTAGGSAVISANRGQISSPSGAFEAYQAYLSTLSATDIDLALTFTFSTKANQSLAITINSDNSRNGTTTATNTGYELRVYNTPTTEIDLSKNGISGQTLIDTNITALTSGFKYRIRFQRLGSTIRYKLWNESGFEPAAWTITYTDAGTLASAGSIMIRNVNGSTAASQSIAISDIVISLPSNVPFTDTFTGNNGDPWADSWMAPLNGLASIQSNAGVLPVATTVASDGNASWLSGMEVLGNTDAVVSFTIPTANASAILGINGTTIPSSTNANELKYGYKVVVFAAATAASSTVQMYTVYNAVDTAVGTAVTMTITPGTQYKVRLQRNGTTLQTRVWQATATEPTTWTTSVAVTNPVSGVPWLATQNGTVAAAKSVTFDDFAVIDPSIVAAFGQLKIWNGTAWVAKPEKTSISGAWTKKPAKYSKAGVWTTTPY